MVPLFFLLLGLFIDTPSRIYIKKEVSKTSINRGESIKVKTKIKIKKGIGLVAIHDELPKKFSTRRR